MYPVLDATRTVLGQRYLPDTLTTTAHRRIYSRLIVPAEIYHAGTMPFRKVIDYLP
jgi:hypothetical protein